MTDGEDPSGWSAVRTIYLHLWEGEALWLGEREERKREKIIYTLILSKCLKERRIDRDSGAEIVFFFLLCPNLPLFSS